MTAIKVTYNAQVSEIFLQFIMLTKATTEPAYTSNQTKTKK